VARRLRIQYPGAIYHVINRGNYRRDLFISAGEARAFLETVREAPADPTGSGRYMLHRPAARPT